MFKPLFSDISFEWPWMLGLLIPLVILFISSLRQKSQEALRTGTLPGFAFSQNTKVFFRNTPNILRFLALGLFVVCMARPVKKQTIDINTGKGIEIVLCLDVSGSMLAKDFLPNRLEASLEVARTFIRRRKGDKIGMVIFAGQSLTMCPITTDHEALIYQLNHIQYGILQDGTSIGSGLASSVERLRLGESSSKIIVLLTDGEDTGGKISPDVATDLARTFGIKVYTIGIGSEGYANIPYQNPTGATVLEKERVSIDEDKLTEIAVSSGGNYYRAKDKLSLEKIYKDIDELEKSDIQTSQFNKKNDAFSVFLFAGLALLLLEWILSYTWLRKFP
jgi:Ca-activated chloride channel family protein